MKELSKESKYARYHLLLPTEIAQSMIAERLNNELTEYFNKRNKMSIHNNTRKIDKISEIICNKLILSFESLYIKYIDSNKSTFEINIII